MQASSNNKQERQAEKDDEAKEKKAENTPPAMDFGNSKDRKTYLNNLAKKYPKGITVENYELKKRKVKRVIVNYDGIATDYRRVKHSWGGTFYFRNGQSISKGVFQVETRERDN